MVLVIDVGNTTVVFGVASENRWVKIWRVQTDRLKTADEYEVIFRSLLASSGINPEEIVRAVLSSVVPCLISPFREMLLHLIGNQSLLVEPSIYERLPIRVDNPSEMGTDLVADAVAAYLGYGGPSMVIDFGTALTFTTVGRQGQILGVAIAPGLQTALKSLTANAAQLHDVRLDAPPSVLGDNTIHALQSGIVLGFAGLVDSIIARTEDELGEKLKVIATGGLSFVLRNISKKIDVIDENLTIEGLRYIATYV